MLIDIGRFSLQYTHDEKHIDGDDYECHRWPVCVWNVDQHFDVRSDGVRHACSSNSVNTYTLDKFDTYNAQQHYDST